jgi:hypothetical protein
MPIVPVRIIGVVPNDQIVVRRPRPHRRWMAVEKY